MEASKQEYTVFTECGYQDTCQDGWRGLSLQGLLDKCHKEVRGRLWLAWAPEAIKFRGGTKARNDLFAESIAAGRLIEKIDGKWVARGVEEEKTTAFVDGVFYQFGADIVEVFTQDYLLDPNAAMIARDGPAKPVFFGFDYAAGCAPAQVSTAKPNPFASFRNPDSCNGPADHLNAARHQMAGMSNS